MQINGILPDTSFICDEKGERAEDLVGFSNHTHNSLIPSTPSDHRQLLESS